MLLWLAKLNRKYDRTIEPWRFLIMCLFVWPPIIVAFSDWFHIGYRLIAFHILIGLLVVRMCWVEGVLKITKVEED